MKNYNCKKIKALASAEIDTIELGMREDWGWTAETVYEDGKFNIDLSGETVSIAGISGSIWATPVAEIEYKDGRTEIVEVWKDDGDNASASDISQSKIFAKLTGGMDYKE